MIKTAEAIIIELAAPRHGVFLRKEALKAGVTSSALDRRVRSGWLAKRHRGVLEVPALRSARTNEALAVLSVNDSHLCQRSAARMHRFALPTPRTIEVVTSVGSTDASPFATVHRSRNLPDDDVVEIDGLSCTTPARTLCDLAAVLRPARLLHLVESQVVAKNPTADELVTCFEAWSGRGVTGSVAMRAILDAVVDDEPVPGSQLELLAMERMIEYRILGARRQFQPPWYDGIRGIVDFAWPGARVILEVDGRRFHTVSQSQDDDEQRDLIALENGWVVIRVGWHTLKNRPTQFMRRLDTILANRTVAAA